MASGDSPSRTPTRCLPRNAARYSCGSSSQDDEHFGLKNNCFSSTETLKMMEIMDNPKGVTPDIPEEDGTNNVSLVGMMTSIHPYHTLEPDYGPPSYYDDHHHHSNSLAGSHRHGTDDQQSAEEIIQAVDDYLRNEHLTPESGNHSNRSSASLSDQGSAGNLSDLREGQLRQEPIQMSTLPSLPVIPEAHHHHHHHVTHSCSSLYPSGTMASTASGYLRVDGSLGSCRSPIYETVSSNEGEQETVFGRGTPRRVVGNSNANGSNSGGSSGCSSCAQLRSIGLRGGAGGSSSTYKHSRSYNLPDNATLATNRALNSLDNLGMHDRPPRDGCSASTPSALPAFMCNEKDRGGTTRTQVVYPHVHQSKDDLKDRPSWRCLAVGFLVFALLLFGVIAFLTVLVMTRAPVPTESFNPSKSSSSESDGGGLGPLVTVPTNGIHQSTTSPNLATYGISGPSAPVSIGPGSVANKTIAPGKFWFLHFDCSDLKIVTYNLTINKHSNLVLYGKRGKLPSHSRFDFVKAYNLNGHRNTREVQEEFVQLDQKSIVRDGRSISGGQRTWTFTEEFVAGAWFLGIFNDGNRDEDILIASRDNAEWRCPNDCSGHGYCVKGQCTCDPTYSGTDCSEGLCPVLCNGQGEYVHGHCICQAGWKGPECNIAWDECLTPDCSGHGMCAQGECLCEPGYTGEVCDQEAVIDRTVCANHSDCMEHAECLHGVCECMEGWTGANCQQQTCLSSCSPHGECVDSRCICDQGWNGKFCRLDGCPQGCMGHGVCQIVNDLWQCVCEDGFDGDGCQIELELVCNDGEDNDGDQLIDCADPDCCTSAKFCSSQAICQMIPDPASVLANVVPSVPFFDHYSSWMEPDGIQFEGSLDSMIEQRHASVVRGRVVTSEGAPIPNVRVAVTNQPQCGYTLTRADGWFDMIVIGGCDIKLEFERSELSVPPSFVNVPINELVVTDDIVVSFGETEEKEECTEDTRQAPRFYIVPNLPDSGTKLVEPGILLNQQSFHEEIKLKPSQMSLKYFSHRSSHIGFNLNLTIQDHDNLHHIQLIHLKIDVAGIRRMRLVEPEPHLSLDFEWKKKNAYGRTVYGKVRAKIWVGYQYYRCNEVAWSVQATTLHGEDWSTTGMAGWFFPIHHTYNPSTGTLLMGDGTKVDFLARTPSIHTIMGNGRPRTASCPQCDGKARNTRLLAPTAVVTSQDGSIFVGDAELIMRIAPNGNSSVVIHLSYVPTYKYHLAVSSLQNMLFLAEPQMRRIYQLQIPPAGSNYTVVEVFAGTGRPCLLVDADGCGDNGPAVDARLYSPKGIAVGKDGKVYFIDGTIIRTVDTDGVISSFLGIPGVMMPFRRPRCGSEMPATKLSLQYPTELAISPLDGALYVVDDDIILRITLNGMASVFAGVASGCFYSFMNTASLADTRKADQDLLESPSAISFSPGGDLYVAETDYSNVHRVRVISPEGYISTVVGGVTPCDCRLEECICFSGEDGPVVNATIQSPIALTVTAQDELIFVDQGNLRIRKLMKEVPRLHRRRFVYEIPSPHTNELFLFDQFGFHFKTKHIVLDEPIYIFNYTDVHNSLVGIQDRSGFAIRIHRFVNQDPLVIEIGKNGSQAMVEVNREGHLIGIENLQDVGYVQLQYQNGLLTRKSERDYLKIAYSYNQQGTLKEARWPTGEVTNLSSQVNQSSAVVTYRVPDRTETVSIVSRKDDRWRETISQGDLSEYADLYDNGSCQVTFTNGVVVTLDTQVSPLLDRVSGEVYHQRKLALPDGSVQTAEWDYVVYRGSNDKILIVERKLKVNEQSVLRLSYNRFSNNEFIQDASGTLLLTLTRTLTGQIKEWNPALHWHKTSMVYDNQGRVISWQRDVLIERYQYNEFGKLTEIRLSNDSVWQFGYHDTNRYPVRVYPPGGEVYTLSYSIYGQLGGVVLPSGTSHFVNTQTTLGVNRETYSFQGEDPWLIVDTIFTGHPSTVFYPRTGRKVSKHYDSRGRLMTVVFDKSLISLNYHRSTGQLKLLELQEGDFQNVLKMKSTGLVMKQQTVVSTGLDGFLNAKFDYTVNSNFQTTVIAAEFNWTLLANHDREFEETTGRVVTLEGFTVSYPDVSRHVISDSVFSMQYTMGEYILLQSIFYFMHDRNILSLSFRYDYSVNINRMNVKSADKVLQFTYKYDSKGFLHEVLLNDTADQSLFRYAYSPNGNLLAVESRDGTLLTLEYDHRDCVTRVGDLEYKFDADGILSQRGEASFEYNSRGLLVHAYKPRAYDVRYKYDGLGRRIWRKDHNRQQVQFFYANPDDKWLITHIYSKNLRELWTLDYDLRGALLSIRRNFRRWYVVTDHLGSILQVLDQEGEVLKELVYDPWGNIMEDSASHLNIYLGYRGGLQDSQTKLVHFRGRDYDPISRRWTSPDVSFYRDLVQTKKLRKFNLYTFQGNTPMNKDLELSYMTDLDSWYSTLGYRMDNLLPAISNQAHLSPFSESQEDNFSWEKESGSIISQVKYKINAFRDQLHILPSNHLSPVLFTEDKVSFKRTPSLLGNGVEMSTPRGRIQTVVTSLYVSGVEYSLAQVLNGSLVSQQWQNCRNGKDFQYFFKTELKKFANDLILFGISENASSSSVASIDTNVTFQRYTTPKEHVKLTVSNLKSVWTIFYGLSGSEVVDSILKEAKAWAVQQAWSKERWAISNGRRGSRHWTSNERNLILSVGSLENYEGRYALDPRDHPAVAFDGNNIHLVRMEGDGSRT